MLNIGLDLNNIVFVNNLKDEKAQYDVDDDTKSIFFYDKAIIEEILLYSIKDVSNFLTYFEFNLSVDWWDTELHIFIGCEEPYIISIGLDFAPEHWAKGWSIVSFSNLMNTLVESLENITFYDYEKNLDILSFSFTISENGLLKNQLNTVIEIATKLANEANEILLNLNDKNSIVSIFDFPDSIKTPCQQYLMYFAQFLKDVGINVTTEIKEQVHSTLFKVTPLDKNEALDKIKETLNLYINAPALSDLQLQNISNNDIAFIQYQANVMHLKSQIMFANSTIQMKNATIEALQLSNYQLKKINESFDDKGKEEDLIPGILSVKKYDGDIFTIDIPEILRLIKRFPKNKIF